MDKQISLPSSIFFQDYCLYNPSRAHKIIDRILDPVQSFAETIQKYSSILKSYISGSQTFEDFCNEVRKYNNSVLCGFVWIHPTISYRCRTCAISPSMSLCTDCFHAGNHQEHDANMFRSAGGGVCDCGDVTVMKVDGFCKHHGPNRVSNNQIPLKYIQSTQIVLPRLIFRFVQYLRSHATFIKSDSYVTIEEFTSLTSFFDLIDDLCNTGSSIRLIFINCLLDTDLYKQFNIQLLSDDLQTITHHVYLQQLKATSSLSLPLSLQTTDLSISFAIKQATCLLDEILFWFIKYQIPERLLKVFLFLLTDMKFKYVFIQSFLNVYGIAISQLTKARNAREKMNISRLVHINTQLFSNKDVTIQAVNEYHLMEIMLSSLYAIFDNIKTKCMNVNHQTTTNYLFAFTIETSYCASALWTIIAHIMTPDYLETTSIAIHHLLIVIKEWLSAIGLKRYTDIRTDEITYHLPLHRYLSILTYISLNYQNNQLKDIFARENETFLLHLAIFPLRIQVVKYEIMTNTIWSYSGYEMQSQSNMYSTVRENLCSYMNDADLYLLQIIVTLVNINTFNEMLFKNFCIPEWLIQKPNTNLPFEKSTYVTLLQGSLIVLASIVAFTPHIALDDFERRRAELIHRLAVQDCVYSYLDEHIAESKGLGIRKHDIQSILDDIAEYISPIIDMSNGPKQGQYRLKGEQYLMKRNDYEWKSLDFLWEDEFDPLFVLNRISRKDIFETTMQRYVKWAKSMNKFSFEMNLWPPYRLHRPKDQFQTNLRCLLQSRYLHGVLFSISYWIMNEKSIHEDILSLVVYLCELAIDDKIRRHKYGEFLNGYASSATEPSQCQTNLTLKNSISLETLTSLEDDTASTVASIPQRSLNIHSAAANDLLERLSELEQCYGSRAIKFDQLSEYEQQVQKEWNKLVETKGSSMRDQMQIKSDSVTPHGSKSNHNTEEHESIVPSIEAAEKMEEIIDGKYETFYKQDDLIINAHTIIEKISFQRVVLDEEKDNSEQNIEENNCTSIEQPLRNLHTMLIQTNSKRLNETQMINMSLVQIFVHLLAKILLTNNDTNNEKTSLNELLANARLKQGKGQIGDGSFYITRFQSHILLWERMIGLTITAFNMIEHDQKPLVPLLLIDPVVLLLRLMLSLPYLINKKLYQILVQAIYNIVYIQGLFAIVSEMSPNEQEIWSSSIFTNTSENNVLRYLRMIAIKLYQANFNSKTKDSKIYSQESINASIRERCSNFLKIAALIQHYLYQSITWWVASRHFQFDFLWESLIKELHIYKLGEPYWFYHNSSILVNCWLDEILSIDNRQSILQIVLKTPTFHSPRFIELPTWYSDLFRSCHNRRCPYCQKIITEPILCLICGTIYSQERCKQKCCAQQTHFIQEHLRTCSGGLNISININSTKTLIQREQHYTYWTSLYLDQHGEEDVNLRRGRILYLNQNRLKFLYSAWISSNLDQIINRWSTDQLEF
ncbi:hypothetical protein I4U23_008127 [Adineta vaga]|nr:hypothetical protein I4U23_008127 [Adineta vaga]